MTGVEVPQTLEYKGGQLNAAPVLEDFQDSPDDEEDTKSSHEYLNDLEEEYQARALLAKSKRFFKKGTQRFSSAKATDQTKCYKYGKKGHFARVCWSKTSISTYQSPFQPKPLSSSQHKPELRPTKDFEAKHNKVKAKLTLLSSTSLASRASMVKNKGLIAEAYEWDDEEVSSNDNEMVEVKVLMALAKENNAVSKEGARNGEWRILGVDQLTEDPSSLGLKDLVFVKSSADDTKVTIPGVERPWLSKAEGFILPNHDIALVKGNKSSSALKVHSALAGKLKSVKIKDDLPLAIIIKELNDLKLQISKNRLSHSRNNQPQQVSQNSLQNKYKTQFEKSCELYGLNNHLSENCYKVLFCKKCISLRRGNKPRNPQHVMKCSETCGSTVHTTTDHNDIEWFKRGKELQTKKVEALKSTRAESSNANRSKTPTRSGCSRHMTGVTSYLHKYVEQSGPKVVFGDDSTCTTKGYGSIKFYIHNHKDHLGKFDEKADDGYLTGYKLKKPITSHWMKALTLSNSQNLQLTTPTLLKQKDIHLINIFILINLLKGIKQTAMMCPS
nr:retrovirus-related Pol polyprotein from transposon TNT 1-94 [Tanacetum cinerariifolium]